MGNSAGPQLQLIPTRETPNVLLAKITGLVGRNNSGKIISVYRDGIWLSVSRDDTIKVPTQWGTKAARYRGQGTICFNNQHLIWKEPNGGETVLFAKEQLITLLVVFHIQSLRLE